MVRIFSGEGLATDQLVVADTPMSELLRFEVPITKCNAVAPSNEHACSLISNHKSVGEFNLFLFGIYQIKFNIKYNSFSNQSLVFSNSQVMCLVRDLSGSRPRASGGTEEHNLTASAFSNIV